MGFLFGCAIGLQACLWHGVESFLTMESHRTLAGRRNLEHLWSMFARIYKPARTAMQSGNAKTQEWVLEFEQEYAKRADPLMGWTSSSDTRSNQVHLFFDTKKQAIAYAKERGIPHQVIEPSEKKRTIKAYADNFAANRRAPWTH